MTIVFYFYLLQVLHDLLLGYLGRVFSKWRAHPDGLPILLDIWHWLQRFEGGLTSPTGHELNSFFWVEMANAIFKSAESTDNKFEDVDAESLSFVSTFVGNKGNDSVD